MLKIYDEGKRIEYTKNDEFELSVRVDEATTNHMLRFVVALDEASLPVIEHQFSYDNDIFNVTLTSNEKEHLGIGNYIFKLILIDGTGKIDTQLSGDLIVKWGV